MKKERICDVEELLPKYLSGDLSEKEQTLIDEWRKESPGNEAFYNENLKVWQATSLLNDMEQFNSFEALKKISSRLSVPNSSKFLVIIQRIAAILLIPFLVYSGYLVTQNQSLKKLAEEYTVMQTISSRQGMITQFSLADGTKVWLNSGSELQFPTRFKGQIREVKLKGEAYFEVAKNEKMPFRVNAKEMNIDVLGTSFNVVGYDEDTQLEVILVEGKVSLSSIKEHVKKDCCTLYPGQRVIYKSGSGEVCTEVVDVDKYIAWREGNLIFRDDSMKDVVKRLNRWYNVEIVIDDPEIKKYMYKATFRNETLTQVLHLLKLSAPINYRIIDSKALTDNEFTKQKIYLMKRKK